MTAAFEAGVGRAQSEGVFAGDRRHADDAAGPRLLQIGNGGAGDEELAVHVDGKCADPVLRRYLLKRGGGTGNAGIVDEDVEPAHGLRRRLDECRSRGSVRHVTDHRPHTGQRIGGRGEVLFGDVADPDLSAGAVQRARNRQPDSGRPRGHDRALSRPIRAVGHCCSRV